MHAIATLGHKARLRIRITNGSFHSSSRIKNLGTCPFPELVEPHSIISFHFRCEKKPRCRIPVESSIFGDPCPGTNTYVEVHYTCEPAASNAAATTAKALPPWLLDLAATPSSIPEINPEGSSTSTTTMSSTTSSTTTTTEAVSTSTVTTTELSQPNTVPNPIYPKSTFRSSDVEDFSEGRHFGNIDKENPNFVDGIEDFVEVSDLDDGNSGNGNEMKILEEIVDHCQPKTMRNLFWNWTRIGEDAIQVCPQGSSGFARWSCGIDGLWSSQIPNLGECQSQWLGRLEQRLQMGGGASAVIEIAQELSASTETKSLYGGDMAVVAKILQGIAHRLRQELYVIASQNEKETLAAEVLQAVLKTTSNLMDPIQRFAWDDLEIRKRSSAVTAVLVAAEENALLLAETVNNEKNVAEATNHILSSIRVMRARGVYDQIFPMLESVHTKEESQMIVPAKALLDNSVNGAVRLVFFLFDNLESVLPGSGNKFVNSKIMGVVASKARFADIADAPVLFKLRHLEANDGTRTPICSAWDYSNQIWSDKDCTLLASNSTHSTCQCNRLAHYAILMEETTSAAPHAAGGNINKSEQGTTNEQTSHLTTAIVCAVALFLCLFLAIVGMILFRRWDVRPRLDKFLQTKKLPCFHCKKSESTNSASGLYPALTSSPTSTTVSVGTPTTAVSASSNYLVQILEQQAETMKQVKAGNTKTLQQPCKGSSIYRVTAPRSQYNLSQQTNVFRPVSPYGHHIYMEIDPVYAHAAESATSEVHSDIQLSDISDDDLKRFSDNSRASSNRYGEERPLIRANQLRQSVPNNDIGRQCFTAHRPNQQQGQLAAAVGVNHQMLRPLHLATLSGSCSHQSLRGMHQPHLTQQRTARPPLQQLYHQATAAQALDTPITIALQGGEQFVSLKIGERQQQEMQKQLQQQQYQDMVYAPVHHHHC